MNTQENRPRGLGITPRTALWSWGVTLLTLVVFAVAILPQQKRTFLENLESKAHGITVSLRDVAAGAVVNEDFSSVVDHCKEMLNGDPGLDFLVIAKQDGFALISERSGWRAEPEIGPDWLPAKRVAGGGVTTVSLFNQRVFHYAQPFDYSGIQWGWIHVGLSLDSYDQSVAAVHRRTLVLAGLCVLLSLVASVLYARHLVGPLLRLRDVVQRLTGGDLTIRAPIERGDEMGTLASSVNAMAGALQHRDRILQSVRYAAQQFLSTHRWQKVIDDVLGRLGLAADVSRAYVFANATDPNGRLVTRQTHEWTAAGIAPQLDNSQLLGFPYAGSGFERWAELLPRGEILAARVADLSAAERAVLESQGIRSLLVIPIHVDGDWWGFLGFDDCTRDRQWTDAERDSLRAAADMLGAAIAQQQAQDALVEAKDQLESRVKDRTCELEEQMEAKAKAHAELAEAQQRLIEASRLAGKAEVATGVLHNVGNVLNSVSVSAGLLLDRATKSKVRSLEKTAGLVREHLADFPDYVRSDPKGRLIPEFLCKLTDHLVLEQGGTLEELKALVTSVEHVKEIVAMQQSYAKVSGVLETLAPGQLVEDALRLNESSLQRHGIRVEREFLEVPTVLVDRHKVLQILINLIRNAKYALDTSDTADKCLRLEVGANGSGRVKVIVRDNGIGIAPENLTKIFSHGFTTKREGHGFGLHSGALAAKEMGGALQAASEGLGRGAVFTLELPIAENQNQTSCTTEN